MDQRLSVTRAFAAVAAALLVKAPRTEALGARAAVAQAGAAEALVAAATGFAALAAADPAAVGAGSAAIETQVCFAALAAGRVLFGACVPAIRAGRAVPAGERDVGAAGVIGLQDSPHEQAEVVEPPFLKGPAYRDPSVSFAEHLIADVRMRCRAV